MHHSNYKLHPWHGIHPGDKCPGELTAFIEISPTDTVKYEIDKKSGYLKIDRPYKYSYVVPALYGFIPRTYCGENIARYCMDKAGIKQIEGDRDPLDILVLTDRIIPRGDILVDCIPIGGLRMVDKQEADDKIIAVLRGDTIYGSYKEVNQLPTAILDRLRHYFLTYKDMPHAKSEVEMYGVYGSEEAHQVINAAIQDYNAMFPAV